MSTQKALKSNHVSQQQGRRGRNVSLSREMWGAIDLMARRWGINRSQAVERISREWAAANREQLDTISQYQLTLPGVE